MYFPEKAEILKGRGGSRLWNSESMGGGGTHFGISESKGGLKHGSRPLLGMDIFWNCPIYAKMKELTYPKLLPFLLFGNVNYCVLFCRTAQNKKTVSTRKMTEWLLFLNI